MSSCNGNYLKTINTLPHKAAFIRAEALNGVIYVLLNDMLLSFCVEKETFLELTRLDTPLVAPGLTHYQVAEGIECFLWTCMQRKLVFSCWSCCCCLLLSSFVVVSLLLSQCAIHIFSEQGHLVICGGLTELSPGARMAIDEVRAYDPKKRVWVTGDEEERSITLPKKMPTALSYLSAGELPTSSI